MQRETGFRVWSIEKKEMAIISDFPSLTFQEKGRWFAMNGDVLFCNFTNGVLMQDTGLRDKNGVKIYEGSILSFPDDEQNIYEMRDIKKPVVFERGAFRVDVTEFFKKVLDDETAQESEVIGDIYQNPAVY